MLTTSLSATCVDLSLELLAFFIDKPEIMLLQHQSSLIKINMKLESIYLQFLALVMSFCHLAVDGHYFLNSDSPLWPWSP